MDAEEAQIKLNHWKEDCSRIRPHGSPANRIQTSTPVAYDSLHDAWTATEKTEAE